MKRALIALVCFAACACCFAQNADGSGSDEPASKDDVILYLRTMRSHDMVQKVMAVQAQSMQQIMHEQLNDKGALPADYDAHMKIMFDDLVKNMPLDDIVQAMIPAYQKHFTHGDIEAMNAFYSSPVGQKVLEELPAVTQEGMQAAMPVMTKYVKEWQERMKHELEPAQKPAKGGNGAPTGQN
jgi:uncharacterized protein